MIARKTTHLMVVVFDCFKAIFQLNTTELMTVEGRLKLWYT
jgi:hypothetical protein